jgi:hypothetical protein
MLAVAAAVLMMELVELVELVEAEMAVGLEVVTELLVQPILVVGVVVAVAPGQDLQPQAALAL